MKISILFAIFFAASCKEKFDPGIRPEQTNFLVVEGFINADGPTNIAVSRTVRLTDTAEIQTEQGAAITIMGEDNTTIPLSEDSAGHYQSDSASLNKNQKYRLLIKTAAGKEYLSDYVAVKQTPPIDSVSWRKENNEVLISVSAHDPQNNTKYYRWEYVETWEYHTFFNSNLEYRNRMLQRRSAENQIYTCWHTVNSSDLSIGSSINLNEDVIFQHPLVHIENGSEKTSIRYSILVKQYALTKEAFDFWTVLKKNTQQVGGIFGVLPSELAGNIHCVTNPKEVVVGFVSVGAVSQKRIFIGWSEDLAPWQRVPPLDECAAGVVPPLQDSIDYYFGRYSALFTPLDFIFADGTIVGVSNSQIRCADCREKGGTNIKPSYWP